MPSILVHRCWLVGGLTILLLGVQSLAEVLEYVDSTRNYSCLSYPQSALQADARELAWKQFLPPSILALPQTHPECPAFPCEGRQVDFEWRLRQVDLNCFGPPRANVSTSHFQHSFLPSLTRPWPSTHSRRVLPPEGVHFHLIVNAFRVCCSGQDPPQLPPQ